MIYNKKRTMNSPINTGDICILNDKLVTISEKGMDNFCVFTENAVEKVCKESELVLIFSMN